MLERLQAFAAKLREAGVPVSNHEMLQAAEALGYLDWSDRESFKAGLRTVLCNAPAHLETFSLLFDLFFAPEGADIEVSPESLDELPEEEVIEMVVRALQDDDDGELRRLALAVIERLSGEASGGFLLYRAMRFLDLDRLLRRTADEEAADDDFDRAVRRMEARNRVGRLREILEQEVRRQMVEQRGAEEVADRIVRVPLEERDFATITSDEIADVRRAVISLARRLSTKLKKLRQQGARGRLDMRKTFRRSLSSGGVMAEPQFKTKTPSRPDLVMICDVSGSVAAFTRFTLLLVACMQVQFPRIRSFLFVDTVDEVTDLLKSEDPAEAIPKALRTADVVWLDGHSDYGHAFAEFHKRYRDSVGDRTHVVILGDARNNYRKSEEWVVKDLASRAKALWWLNPEARRHWDTGDSVMGDYEGHCTGVYEVRNLKQLGGFIEHLA